MTLYKTKLFHFISTYNTTRLYAVVLCNHPSLYLHSPEVQSCSFALLLIPLIFIFPSFFYILVSLYPSEKLNSVKSSSSGKTWCWSLCTLINPFLFVLSSISHFASSVIAFNAQTLTPLFVPWSSCWLPLLFPLTSFFLYTLTAMPR